MSSSATSANEATSMATQFKYIWNDDARESWAIWTYHRTPKESPLFGPENCEKIKLKLKLNFDDSIRLYEFYLILVSCEESSLELKYSIFYNTTSNEKIPSRNKDITLSIGQQLSVLNIGGLMEYIKSFQFEFELKESDNLINKLEKPQVRTLLTDLNSLRLKSHFTDVTFVVGKKELPANKVILAARSPVFEVMFSSEEFVENQQDRVDITDIDEKVLGALLDFIYTSEVENLDGIAPDLLVPAHKYQIPSLVELCAQSMIRTIDNENAVNFLLHAKMYNLADLKNKAIDFINRNSGKITKCEDWIKNVKPNLSLMTELYLNLVDKHPQT